MYSTQTAILFWFCMKIILTLFTLLTVGTLHGQFSDLQFEKWLKVVDLESTKLKDVEKWVDLIEENKINLTSSQLYQTNHAFCLYYHKRLDYTNAFMHCLSALYYARKTGDYKKIGSALYRKAKLEFEINHFYESTTSLNLALELFRDKNDLNMIAISLNLLGNNSIKLGEDEKGLKYSREALAIGNKTNDKYLQSALVSNIGFFYLTEKSVDSAIYFIEKGLALEKEFSNEEKGYAEAFGNLAYAYTLKKEYEKATAYFDSSFAIATQNREVITLLNLHKDRAFMYRKKEQYELALYDMEKADSIKLWFDNKTQAESIAALKISILEKEKKAELKRAHLISKQMQYENEIQTFRNYFIISCLMSSLVISFLIFLKFRTSSRNEKILLAQEKDLVKLDLKLTEATLENQKLTNERLIVEINGKNEDLTNFALHIGRKNEYVVKLMKHLKELQAAPETQMKVKVQELIAFTKHQQFIDQNLEEFQMKYEKVNYQFLNSLTKTYTNLTKSDLNLCSLIRLGLTAKDISSLRGISPESVEMSRYRLRKKLALPQEVDLFIFLQKIG